MLYEMKDDAVPWHLSHEVEDDILCVEITFQKHNGCQTNENGDIKVPVYIKDDLTDLVSGLIYKNLFFSRDVLNNGMFTGYSNCS